MSNRAEFELAHREHSALKVLGRQHLVEQRARQLVAGVDVLRQHLQNLPFPRKVFHELRGQFDRVPLDALDAAIRDGSSTRVSM